MFGIDYEDYIPHLSSESRFYAITNESPHYNEVDVTEFYFLNTWDHIHDVPVISSRVTVLDSPIFYWDYDLRTAVWLYRDASNGQGSVPEPATMLLIGSGLVFLTGLRRRSRKK